MLTDDRRSRWVAAHPVEWGIVGLEAVLIIGPSGGGFLSFAGVAVGRPTGSRTDFTEDGSDVQRETDDG
jgi:hypothetical protein